MLKAIVITSPRVNEFLEAKGRNSFKSKESYKSALKHLSHVLEEKYPSYDYDNIIDAIKNNKVDVYEVLNNFISYATKRNITPKSIRSYSSALKSYFGFFDVDIIPSKLQRRVVMPRISRVDEEAIEASDIRKILLACNNRRLKAYLLVLASCGCRAVEGLAIRNKDIDFSTSPTKIKIRADYSKTRTERIIYISNEATEYLKKWQEWKYRPDAAKEYHDDDLVFTAYGTHRPENLYNKAWMEFQRLLTIVKLDERKDEGVRKRHKLTIHSLRRFVYTTTCDVADQAYAEFFLGHAQKSVYHTKKESAKREIYQNKILKYLTFLDYSGLEAAGKSIESKMTILERENAELKQRIKEEIEARIRTADNYQSLAERVSELEKDKQRK